MQSKVFISYAWGGESEQIATQVDQALTKKGLSVIRDKNNGLAYKGSISEFMQVLGQGNFVVIIISDKYLKSENCMFELIEISKNGDFTQRIFPIILDDAFGIYKAHDRIDYVNYWEKEVESLDKKMREVSSANLQGIREEMDLFTEIRSKIAGLAGILKNMNALTPEMHQNENFESIYQQIDKALSEGEKLTDSPTNSHKPLIEPPVNTAPSSIDKEKKKNWLTTVSIVAGILVSLTIIWTFVDTNFNKFDFSIKLRANDDAGIPRGKLMVDNGQEEIAGFFDQTGKVAFEAVPNEWLNKTVKFIYTEDENLELENPDSLYLLSENTSEIIVHLKDKGEAVQPVAITPKKVSSNKTVKVASYFATSGNAQLGIICNVESKSSPTLAGKVKSVMSNKGFSGNTTVVKPTFVTSGTFDKVLYGNYDILQKQNAEKAMKYLMMVKQGAVNSSATEATCNFQVSIVDLANATEVYNDNQQITIKGDYSNENPQMFLYTKFTRDLGRASISLP